MQGLIPIEREVRDAQGHWYLVRLLPYRTVEDRIAGIVLTLVDITERKGSQEALKLSEQRFDAIAEKAVVGVVQTVLDGCITFANHFYHRVLGYADGALIGLSVFDRMHPDDRASVRERFAGVCEIGHFETDLRCLRRDGSVHRMHAIVTWLPVPEDSGGSLLIVCSDVGDR